MMEAIWDDLARDPVTLSSPEWHAHALNEAEQAHAENRADFVPWDIAKKMLCDKQDHDLLRSLLVEGAQSEPTGLADDAYFSSLHSGINSR